MKERLIVGIVSIAVFVGITASASFADPDLSLVSPHRHFIEQPDGTRVPVGPQICGNTDNLGLWKAFSQFHNNLHVSAGFPSLKEAPGLHNGRGGEIKALPGCP